MHSIDVIRAFVAFAHNPRPDEPYNLGSGRENSASVLESIGLIEELTGHKIQWCYVEQNRRGDHMCYISDLRKLKAHYPEWSISRSLRDILQEMMDTERARL
jgi:CDP-paratose 2-epimerase